MKISKEGSWALIILGSLAIFSNYGKLQYLRPEDAGFYSAWAVQIIGLSLIIIGMAIEIKRLIKNRKSRKGKK